MRFSSVSKVSLNLVIKGMVTFLLWIIVSTLLLLEVISLVESRSELLFFIFYYYRTVHDHFGMFRLAFISKIFSLKRMFHLRLRISFLTSRSKLLRARRKRLSTLGRNSWKIGRTLHLIHHPPSFINPTTFKTLKLTFWQHQCHS